MKKVELLPPGNRYWNCHRVDVDDNSGVENDTATNECREQKRRWLKTPQRVRERRKGNKYQNGDGDNHRNDWLIIIDNDILISNGKQQLPTTMSFAGME